MRRILTPVTVVAALALVSAACGGIEEVDATLASQDGEVGEVEEVGPDPEPAPELAPAVDEAPSNGPDTPQRPEPAPEPAGGTAPATDPVPDHDPAPNPAPSEEAAPSTGEPPTPAPRPESEPTSTAGPGPSPERLADPCAAHTEVTPGFIDVVSPVEGQHVAGGFALAGCANVHEGTVGWRLLGSDGEVLDEGFTTADCAITCNGTFADTVSSTGVGSGASVTLEVFSENVADDGPPRLHQRSVVLTVG